MVDVKKASMAELVNYYNAKSGKSPVKKFADRKTAERRVASLMPTPKSAVTADGVQYRSVKQAFERLRLPLGRHIPFRMKLKKEKSLTFEHNDRKVKFAIVK